MLTDFFKGVSQRESRPEIEKKLGDQVRVVEKKGELPFFRPFSKAEAFSEIEKHSGKKAEEGKEQIALIPFLPKMKLVSLDGVREAEAALCKAGAILFQEPIVQSLFQLFQLASLPRKDADIEPCGLGVPAKRGSGILPRFSGDFRTHPKLQIAVHLLSFREDLIVDPAVGAYEIPVLSDIFKLRQPLFGTPSAGALMLPLPSLIPVFFPRAI